MAEKEMCGSAGRTYTLILTSDAGFLMNVSKGLALIVCTLTLGKDVLDPEL